MAAADEGVTRIGVDDDVLAGDLGRELERGLGGVALAGGYDAVVLDGAEEPLLRPRSIQGRLVGEVDLVKERRVLGRARSPGSAPSSSPCTRRRRRPWPGA